jgi:hypothetical protein
LVSKHYKTVHIAKCRPNIALAFNYEEEVRESGDVAAFILNSALDGGEGLASSSDHFTTRKESR